MDAVFSALAGSATNDRLQEIELEMAPRLSAHADAIYLNPKLFARLDSVWQRRADLGLDAESLAVLSRIHLDFVRAGARISAEARKRMDAINQRLARLSTRFSQNVLADEEEYVEPLSESQVAGVPDALRQALAATARERELSAPFAVTLSRSSIEPFLQTASDRGLCAKNCSRPGPIAAAMQGARNNSAIIAETLCFAGGEGSAFWAMRIMPPTSWPTAWRQRRPAPAPCSTRSGRRRAGGRWRNATLCRR